MIGDALKKIRTIYGYKAGEISELLDISNSYLSEIENNKKQPSLELLKKYSDIFEIKVSSLLLLSENLDKWNNKDGGKIFIKNMMLKLIEKMSSNTEESENETD